MVFDVFGDVYLGRFSLRIGDPWGLLLCCCFCRCTEEQGSLDVRTPVERWTCMHGNERERERVSVVAREVL